MPLRRSRFSAAAHAHQGKAQKSLETAPLTRNVNGKEVSITSSHWTVSFIGQIVAQSQIQGVISRSLRVQILLGVFRTVWRKSLRHWEHKHHMK